MLRNQAKGLKGLTDKVSSGDIAVFQTDKLGLLLIPQKPIKMLVAAKWEATPS